jgi:hypothetical protein
VSSIAPSQEDRPSNPLERAQKLSAISRLARTCPLRVSQAIDYHLPLVSKRTVKRKLRKKKKANHGKKPNCG